MSAPHLTSLKQPIAIRSAYIATKPTTLYVAEHIHGFIGFASSHFTISRNDSLNPAGSSKTAEEAHHQQTKLFFIKGKLMAWKPKLAFCDASGLPMFDMYRPSMSTTWFVELPDERSGRPMVRIEPLPSTRWRDQFDVHIWSIATESKQQTRLSIRRQDISRRCAHVYLGDDIVMTAKRTGNAMYFPSKRPKWTLDVAEGFDLSIASIIAVVLAVALYGGGASARAYGGGGA